jgi:hypothetical protein
VALTAALGPDPDALPVLRSSGPLVDVDALAEALERRQAERARAAEARAALAGELEPVLAAERERAEAERRELAAALGSPDA